ncbi:hypothetical protein MAR_018676, partial [Mya arenaria]
NPKSRNLPKPKTYNESSYSKAEVEAKYPSVKHISLESAHKPVSFEHKTDVTESQPDIKVTHRVLSQKNIIFVVAYMRSGSTMTASFLEANPGTFYRFEPLGGVYNTTYKITEMSNVMKKEIQAWLTCNMTLLSMESIL